MKAYDEALKEIMFTLKEYDAPKEVKDLVKHTAFAFYKLGELNGRIEAYREQTEN